MSTYVAWDGNEYPLPTPDGWYFASDSRWWPDGHGPGPGAVQPEPAATTPRWADVDEPTIYSSPAPGSGSPSEPLAEEPPKRRGRIIVAAVAGLVLLGAIAAGAFLVVGSDDAPETVDESLFDEAEADEPEPTVTAPDADPPPESTATTVPGKGSREDPYEIGEVFTVEYDSGDEGQIRVWSVEILGAARDITTAVAEENQFNEPPAEGQQFIAVPLRLTYLSGPEPASVFDLSFKALGPSAVVLNTYSPSCQVIPDALDTLGELFQGGSVEGNVCWPMSAEDAAQPLMIVEPFLTDVSIFVDIAG